MDSVKILLFSDDEKLYNSTERIIGKKHQLKWCTYQQLENNRYPTADVVIFHFTILSFLIIFYVIISSVHVIIPAHYYIRLSEF